MAFEEDKRICCVVETEEMCCLQCPLGLALEMGEELRRSKLLLHQL